MKKLQFSLLVLVIGLLTGCSLLGAAETTIAFANMEELQNYRMDMSIKVDGESFVDSYILVDVEQGYEQVNVLGMTIDLFIKDDGMYIIDYSTGYSVALYSEEYSVEEEDYDDFSIFTDVEFEQDGDYWVMTGENELFEDVSEVKFLIVDSLIKEMIMTGTMEGIEMEISILFSMYDEVDVTVPEYITQDEYNDFIDYLDLYNVTIEIENPESFMIYDDFVWVDCGVSVDNECFFEADPAFYYNWVEDTYVTDDETFETFADFDTAYPNSNITESIWEAIQTHLELSGLK